jgi:YhcH/YjgK/YiaL family protein
MVIDSIVNAQLYFGLAERIKIGLKFLQDNSFENLAPGRYEIDGDSVYAMVSSYSSKPIENGKWEAHKNYIDIQYVANGIERIGYSNISSMKVMQEYDAKQDYLLLDGKGSFLTANAGTFQIFYPEDAHMPGIAAEDNPSQVLKVVVKVKV